MWFITLSEFLLKTPNTKTITELCSMTIIGKSPKKKSLNIPPCSTCHTRCTSSAIKNLTNVVVFLPKIISLSLKFKYLLPYTTTLYSLNIVKFTGYMKEYNWINNEYIVLSLP